MNARIKFEPPYKKKDLVQCHRCQRYNHSRRYCNRSPRCVKCGDDHLTETCTKDKRTPAKCALCDDAHPANYKGCRVYRELVSRTYNFKYGERNIANYSATTHHQNNYNPSPEDFPTLNVPSQDNPCPRESTTHPRSFQSYTHVTNSQTADLGRNNARIIS